MKETIFFSAILIFGGMFFAAICSLLLTLVSVPGTLLWSAATRRNLAGLQILAFSFIWLPQLYLGLAFVAGWVRFVIYARSSEPGPWPFVIWPLAFAVCIAPATMALRGAYTTKQDAEALADSRGLLISWSLTLVACVIGFFVFAFMPQLIHPLWSWVDYWLALQN